MGFILTSVLRKAAPTSLGVWGTRCCPSQDPTGCVSARVPRWKAGGSAQATERGHCSDVGGSGPPSRLPGLLTDEV